MMDKTEMKVQLLKLENAFAANGVETFTLRLDRQWSTENGLGNEKQWFCRLRGDTKLTNTQTMYRQGEAYGSTMIEVLLKAVEDWDTIKGPFENRE